MKSKSGLKALTAIAAIVAGMACSSTASAGWTAYGGNGGTTTVNPGGSVTFDATGPGPGTWTDTGGSGKKAFYGNNDYDGQALSVLTGKTLTYGPGNPYVNIYVTDGTQTAVLLALVTNSVNFATATYQAFETVGAGPLSNGSIYTWADLLADNLTINTDGVLDNVGAPTIGWGIADGDGITLGWGNKAGSALYALPTTIAADPTFVPEPGTLALMGVSLVGIAAIRRKKVTA